MNCFIVSLVIVFWYLRTSQSISEVSQANSRQLSRTESLLVKEADMAQKSLFYKICFPSFFAKKSVEGLQPVMKGP